MRHARLVGVIRELVCNRPENRPRRLVHAMGIVTAAGALLLGLDARPVHPAITPPPDAHAWMSLNEAINIAFCGKSGYASSQPAPADLVTTHPELYRESLRKMVVSQSGSIDAYCRTLTNPVINNENSLMLLMSAVFRIDRDVSLHGLGVALSRLRLVLWSVFAIVLCWSGASVLLTMLVLYVGGAVLRVTGLQLSVYSFLLVLPPIVASLYIPVFRPGSLRKMRSKLTFVLAAGAVSAFAVNLRTSYLPMYVTFFLVWMVTKLRLKTASDGRESQNGETSLLGRYSAAATKTSIALLVACGVGYAATDRLIARVALPPAGTTSTNFAHHPIAHPIVLGIATPENEFARRHGVRWEDSAGLELARRVDPNVTYLGPGYESALFGYYRRLWRSYPWEMCQLYWLKLQRAAYGMFEWMARAGLLPGLTRARARRLDQASRGSALLAASVAATIAALGAAIRQRSRVMFAVALLSIAACGVLVESTIVAPTFTPMYYSYLLFYFVFLPAFATQFAIDVLMSHVAKWIGQARPIVAGPRVARLR